MNKKSGMVLGVVAAGIAGLVLLAKKGGFGLPSSNSEMDFQIIPGSSGGISGLGYERMRGGINKISGGISGVTATLAAGTTGNVARVTVTNTSVYEDTTEPAPYTFQLNVSVGSWLSQVQTVEMAPAEVKTIEFPFDIPLSEPSGNYMATATLKTTDTTTIISGPVGVNGTVTARAIIPVAVVRAKIQLPSMINSYTNYPHTVTIENQSHYEGTDVQVGYTFSLQHTFAIPGWIWLGGGDFSMGPGEIRDHSPGDWGAGPGYFGLSLQAGRAGRVVLADTTYAITVQLFKHLDWNTPLSNQLTENGAVAADIPIPSAVITGVVLPAINMNAGTANTLRIVIRNTSIYQGRPDLAPLSCSLMTEVYETPSAQSVFLSTNQPISLAAGQEITIDVPWSIPAAQYSCDYIAKARILKTGAIISNIISATGHITALPTVPGGSVGW